MNSRMKTKMKMKNNFARTDKKNSRVTGKILFAILALTLFLGANINYAIAYSANINAPEAWATDTIAGFDTTVKTSRTLPDTDLIVNLDRPNGTRLIFNQTTDSSGYSEFRFDGLHAKKAGVYFLSVTLKDNGVTGRKNTFKVYPDQVSPTASNVLIDKQTLRPNNNDYATLNVTLTDQYDNPIENHQINVISSRTSDKIESFSTRDYTNANGSVMFKVNSNTSGISVYSIYDATSKIVLNKRASVLYSGGSIGAVGGNEDLFANVFGPEILVAQQNAQSTDPVYMFKFEDIPDQLNISSVVTFSLSAVDSKGATVSNYTGTMHFSADGDNSNDIVLPDDYMFSAVDMGKHTFANAMTFKKSGTFKIQATDLKNPEVKGEVILTVDGSAGVAPQPDTNVMITNPVAGKYNVNTHVVSGTGMPGSDAKIFDNNEEIGQIASDASGAFSFTTPPLSDGIHVIYGASVNDKGVILGISNKINLEIDTTPAAIDSVILLPEKDISKGSPVVITIVTEANMVRVAILIGGKETVELQPVDGKPGTYQGSFQAPPASGTYNIDILLTDSLNNESSYKNQKSFNVTDASALKPFDVTGLKAFPGNGRVTLVWNPATDVVGIDHYRIYFGVDTKSMTNVVDTFDASPTWYIPNLPNDTMLYFAVKAINKDGNDSQNPSAIASSVPSENADPIPFGAPIDESLLDDALFEEEDIYVTETGPASVIIFLISGFGAAGAFLVRRKIRR